MILNALKYLVIQDYSTSSIPLKYQQNQPKLANS